MSKKPTSGTFGGSDYQRGALERLHDARILLFQGRFAGTIHLAGRAVEGMLRAVIWHSDVEIQQGKKSLETGHNLREMLMLIRRLGLLRTDGGDDEFEAEVNRVGRMWFNNMRFAPSRFVESRWRQTGELAARQTFKQAASEFFRSCTAIIKRCET